MAAKASAEDIAGGIALRIAAAGCFSVMSAVLKLASLDGVVAPEMLFYRAVFGVPVVLIWVMTSQGGLSALSTRRPWAHVGRSALGIVSILCLFQTLTLLPLAGAGDCCGFGGTFAVKQAHLSEEMTCNKVDAIVASGAEAVVSSDCGCLMNIGGALKKAGHSIRTLHLAELLEPAQ